MPLFIIISSKSKKKSKTVSLNLSVILIIKGANIYMYTEQQQRRYHFDGVTSLISRWKISYIEHMWTCCWRYQKLKINVGLTVWFQIFMLVFFQRWSTCWAETKWSLCVAKLRRRHKKQEQKKKNSYPKEGKNRDIKQNNWIFLMRSKIFQFSTELIFWLSGSQLCDANALDLAESGS